MPAPLGLLAVALLPNVEEEPRRERLPRHIFSFWHEERLPTAVAGCFRLLSRLNPDWTLSVITPESALELQLAPPPQSDSAAISPQHLADWYRLEALYRHGGVWMDASNVQLQPLDSWVDQHSDALQGFLYPHDNETMENWAIAAPAQSDFVGCWLAEYRQALTGFDAYCVAAAPEHASPGLREGLPYLTQHLCWRVCRARLRSSPLRLRSSVEPGGPMHYLWRAAGGDRAYLRDNLPADYDASSGATTIAADAYLPLVAVRRLMSLTAARLREEERETPFFKLRGSERDMLQALLESRASRCDSHLAAQLLPAGSHVSAVDGPCVASTPRGVPPPPPLAASAERAVIIRPHVITLDAGSARYSAFRAANAHLLANLTVWRAVDGRELRLSELVPEVISPGLLASEEDLNAGSVGTALSHRRVWQHVADSEETALVLEDDAVTHPQIEAWASRNHELLAAADLTLCAFNQDTITATIDPRTGSGAISAYDPPQPYQRPWIHAALRSTCRVRRVRLSHAWGTACYWLSPQGARALLRRALPLSTESVFRHNDAAPSGWPPPGKEAALYGPFEQLRAIAQASIDSRLNALYDELDAYILAPRPLAYTENDKAESTIRRRPGVDGAPDPAAVRVPVGADGRDGVAAAAEEQQPLPEPVELRELRFRARGGAVAREEERVLPEEAREGCPQGGGLVM